MLSLISRVGLGEYLQKTWFDNHCVLQRFLLTYLLVGSGTPLQLCVPFQSFFDGDPINHVCVLQNDSWWDGTKMWTPRHYTILINVVKLHRIIMYFNVRLYQTHIVQHISNHSSIVDIILPTQINPRSEDPTWSHLTKHQMPLHDHSIRVLRGTALWMF